MAVWLPVPCPDLCLLVTISSAKGELGLPGFPTLGCDACPLASLRSLSLLWTSRSLRAGTGSSGNRCVPSTQPGTSQALHSQSLGGAKGPGGHSGQCALSGAALGGTFAKRETDPQGFRLSNNTGRLTLF